MIRYLFTPKTAILMLLSIAGCSESLVFTEKTGFNAAVNIDAAQGSPIETNLGLTRRVAGLVPPIRKDKYGNSDGEAANLVGGFQVVQDPDDNNVFNTTVRVASGYATGPAALALIGELSGSSQSTKVLPTGETAAAIAPKDEKQTLAAVASVMRPAQVAKASSKQIAAESYQKACLDLGGKWVHQKNDAGKLVQTCEQ
ncbi:hypothetical protein [Pseudophaeobacter leonis]|uniref:hypothetical protein n=1 Tax=Pseudophaeobacter leonis TaxID=1144477 RepID=UPI0009F460CE|nr:hypothetical protein [Pseudophaeobacter leonis]